MYNRYIPQSDGSFQRNRIQEQRQQPVAAKQNPTHPSHLSPSPPCDVSAPAPHSHQSTSAAGFLKHLLPKDFDTGDLLIVLLLLLMAGDCEEEKSNAFLTLSLYFFM